MNYGISILFRAIPLAMAAFCFAYGAYVFAAGDDPSRLTAGPVLFFLGSICIALYCTAATIIRQIIGTYTAAAKYLFPAIGYAVAAMTVICGLFIIQSHMTGALVTGHVICGLGFITACVSTAATSSTRFSLIPKNSGDSTFSVNPAGFTRGQSSLLIFIVSAIATGAWVWCILLFALGTLPAHIVAGSVMFGIACVCTSLIALVASIARQARGSYTMEERRRWMGLVLAMGGLAFVLGLILFGVLFALQFPLKLRLGRAQWPVYLYGAIVALMAGCAICSAFISASVRSVLMLLGGALFLISDTFLLIRLFSPYKKWWFGTVVLATYYPAQILLALSILAV